MNKSTNNLQDIVLNGARKNRIPVTLYLMNGFQLKGNVTGFDSFTVVLNCEGKQMMIYKHAISTITPSKPILFNDVVED
jgi:host factor-I protein